MAAMDAESDYDLAFRLQIQEAMAASLGIHPSSSSSPSQNHNPNPKPKPNPKPSSEDEDLAQLISLQTLELDRLKQEREDAERCQAEMRRIMYDFRRRTRDERFAREIHEMPDDEWEDYGDDFERPIDDGLEEEEPFRLYFKGMSSQDLVGGKWVQYAAIAVAVCDSKDDLVLKIQKPLSCDGVCREVLEAKALIEGLNSVISLGIKKVHVFCDYRALHNHVIGKWGVKQRKVANLINHVQLLQMKFGNCQMFLLPRCRVRFVFRLAREVIDAEIAKNFEQNGSKDLIETCNICLEDTNSCEMFANDGCLHRFCFSCMKQHVEVKLLYGMLPGCPHDGCNSKVNVESSRKFLPPRLLEILAQRIKETSIPPAERVYCPYPKCSALMSITEAISVQQESTSKQHLDVPSGLRKCIKCSRSFCINCKVPWHDRLSCSSYRRLHPYPRAEDAKFQYLAKEKLWRQCVSCSNMIELSEGCYHITCRCGHEFCYLCGAEYRDKEATCSCPLWDERYIWIDDDDDEGEDSEDVYGEEDTEDDDDYYF